MTQRLVDQFNADERLWKKLIKLDLLEFTKARPPQDGIGQLTLP